MTRFVLFAYMATKEANAVAGVMTGLLAPLPKGFLKPLTFDNGKDFAQIGQALGVEVYFAKPCHLWERGTNENRNGVVQETPTQGAVVRRHHRGGDTPDRLHAQRPPAPVPQLAHAPKRRSRNSTAATRSPPHNSNLPLLEIAYPWGQHRRKAKSLAEACFTGPNQNCYNVGNK